MTKICLIVALCLGALAQSVSMCQFKKFEAQDTKVGIIIQD